MRVTVTGQESSQLLLNKVLNEELRVRVFNPDALLLLMQSLRA